MRYRVGEEVTAAQVVTGTDDMLLLTCAIGIFIGLVLTTQRGEGDSGGSFFGREA